MTTLQAATNRRIAGREYVKYQIVIPPHFVRALGWPPGQRLGLRQLNRNKLLVEPTQPVHSTERVTYRAFSSIIVEALSPVPEGMTWSQIRECTGLPLTTPPAIWISRMELEHSLTRTKLQGSSQSVWKLKAIKKSSEETNTSTTGKFFNDLTKYLGEQ